LLHVLLLWVSWCLGKLLICQYGQLMLKRVKSERSDPCKPILYINSLRPWRSSGFRPTRPGANRRAKFPVPSLWAKLLEEIRLRHSSAERRPEIADVKNGVPGRVRSGLCVTELSNFCSREHPLRETSIFHDCVTLKICWINSWGCELWV